MKREEWVFKECDGEVDDVCHWLLQCSAWNSFRQPLLKAMNGVGEAFLTKAMETEQPFIITCMYRNYTFYLSLTLCGQLGSSNQSALFIHYHH